MTDIRQNTLNVIERVRIAAEKSGRRPEDISLVAATKCNDRDAVQAAIAAGIRICGENRVQELGEKLSQNAYDGADIHFIGHLQKNKVKNVVGQVSLIHGTDSAALMEQIGRAAVRKGIIQDILLEVNVGAEESKSGFAPEEIPAVLELAPSIPGIRVRGLMAIPPICACGEENIPYFMLMKQLFVDNGRKKYDNVRMDFMSMGMSGDFEAAIACGANMVRVGSAIFGPRVYPDRQQDSVEAR